MKIRQDNHEKAGKRRVNKLITDKMIAEILILLLSLAVLLEGCGKAGSSKSEESSAEQSDNSATVQDVESTEETDKYANDPIGKMLDESGYDYVRVGDSFFIFYYQDGQAWSDMDHGYDATMTVGRSGCGSVSLAMVLTAMTQNIEDYTPDKIVQCEIDNQIVAPNKSVDSIVQVNKALDTGFTVKYHSGGLDLDKVDEVLADGGYIILDQKADTGKDNAEVFATFNHYIVIRGGNQTDGYYIANSISRFSAVGSTERFAPQNTTCIPAEMFEAKYWYTITK